MKKQVEVEVVEVKNVEMVICDNCKLTPLDFKDMKTETPLWIEVVSPWRKSLRIIEWDFCGYKCASEFFAAKAIVEKA